MPIAALAAALWVLVAATAHAQPLQGRSTVSSTVSSTTDGNLVVFSGTGGKRVKDGGAPGALVCSLCVTAASAFGTDNVLVRSDGTGRGTQATAITVDDSNRLGLGTATPSHTVTHGSSSTGTRHYNVEHATDSEYATTGFVANAFTIEVNRDGTGTQRAFRLLTGNGANTNGIQIDAGAFVTRFLTSAANVHVLRADGAAGTAAALRVHGNVTNATTFAAVQLGNVNNLTGASGTQVGAEVALTFQQSSTAAYKALRVNATETSTGSGQKDLLSLEVGATQRARVSNTGHVYLDTTVTPGGTTGNATINKPSGTVNFAAAASSLTLTNSEITTSSIISCIVRTNDTTAKSCVAVPGSGSATVVLNAAATAETSVGFVVWN
jgi:hypothetical protein